MEPLFSFVVLADPHLYGSVTHEENAVDAVEWVNENRVERGIELVVILGDVAWSAGLEGSPELLGALEVPWVPIIGDNSIQSDDEQQWAETFEPQFLLQVEQQLMKLGLGMPAPGQYSPEHAGQQSVREGLQCLQRVRDGIELSRHHLLATPWLVGIVRSISSTRGGRVSKGLQFVARVWSVRLPRPSVGDGAAC